MANFTNVSHKLVIRETPRINAIHTDSNHMQRFANSNPQMFDDMLYEAFHSKQLYGNPIEELTRGRNMVRNLTGESDSWQWKQVIRNRPAVVLENLESTNTTPGIRKTRFKIKLDQNWFEPGEVITPDKENLVRIVQDDGAVYQESGGWVYTVEYATDDLNKFFPTRFLNPGTEFISMFPLYGEQAAQAASIHFDGNIILQDTLADMIRLQKGVTGYVEDMVLQFEQWEADPATGKPTKLVDKSWMSRTDTKFWRTLDMAKWNLLFYGVGDPSLSGEKGYKVRMPYGFKYQLENWSNVETYNTMSETLIRDYLMDLFIGRVAAEQRNVEMLTGEVGFRFFDDAFKRESNKFLITEKTVFTGTDPMDLSYGYQIKEYKLINGGKVSLRKLLFPDIAITQGMRDTTTGFPKESANFYIFDLSGDNNSNLQIVKRPESLQWGYVHGTRAPWQLTGQVLSNTEDGYKMIARDRCSPWIKDVSACGVLKWKPN